MMVAATKAFYVFRTLVFSLSILVDAGCCCPEAKSDANINGYTIRKGWKVLVWFRTVHLDPKIYPDPLEFNPNRWNKEHKAGEFLPFGAGTKLCPGNDLAKIEIAVFLHHFILSYQLEQVNPKGPVRYLPHTRPMDNCLARIRKCPATST